VEGWVGLDTTTVSKHFAQDRYVAEARAYYYYQYIIINNQYSFIKTSGTPQMKYNGNYSYIAMLERRQLATNCNVCR